MEGPEIKKRKSSSRAAASKDYSDASSQSRSYESEYEPPLKRQSSCRFRSDGRKYVKKGSLTESELIGAKNKARSSNKVKRTEEERKKERRAANRLSAFQSRQRRKIIIEELQKTACKQLNDKLEQERLNSQLKSQIESVFKENELLCRQLAAATMLYVPATPKTHAAVPSTASFETFLGAERSSMSQHFQHLTSLHPATTNYNDGLLTRLAMLQQLHQQQRQQALLSGTSSEATSAWSQAAEMISAATSHSQAEIAQPREQQYQARTVGLTQNNKI